MHSSCQPLNNTHTHTHTSSHPAAGVRIITGGAHQLLRRVPPPAARVLELGSTHPGALLYDARRLFDAQDARATGAAAAGGCLAAGLWLCVCACVCGCEDGWVGVV